MRRWIRWILVLGAGAGLLVLGMLWRKEPRLEPIEPSKLIQLSESERVEWLVAQILARSRSGVLKWKLLSLMGFDSERGGYTLDAYEMNTLAEACRRYRLDHWMRRLPAYALTSAAEWSLRKNQALWRLEHGDLRTAEMIVQHIPQGREHVIALAHLAVAYAQRGDRVRVRETLQRLPANLMRSFELQMRSVVEALLQAGMLEEAADLCAKEHGTVLASVEAPRSVLDAYLRAGRWEDALRWARRLSPTWREFALIEWTTRALQQGDPDPTRHLHPHEQTPALLLRIAHLAQERNMPQQARRWRNAAQQRLHNVPGRERNLQLYNAVIELMRIGNDAEAEKLIKQINSDILQSEAAHKAASIALEHGDWKRVQRFTQHITAPIQRAEIETRIAARYYHIGEQEKAHHLIERLVQTISRADPALNAVSIARICRSAIKEGAYPLVQPLLHQLEGEIAKTPSVNDRLLMLSQIIDCYAQAGELESAFRLAAQERSPKKQASILLMILDSLTRER
ncbi:MAG: hypothetical protein CFK49_09330 [Armatimonadetes bacterium JP3_11]|nr:MAG: hypothetical protein CFK49_09330 [Armatimonadetes bacterium JP3_11]